MHANVNEHLKRKPTDLAIRATLVSDPDQRMQCLPAIAGHRCVVLEHTIYDMMGRMTDDYDGGFWNYYQLSNGGFYMAPKTDKTFDFACENGFQREMSADTAGIVATAMAYSHLSFLKDGDCFARAYYLLSDFIFQHHEAGVIRAALD